VLLGLAIEGGRYLECSHGLHSVQRSTSGLEFWQGWPRLSAAAQGLEIGGVCGRSACGTGAYRVSFPGIIPVSSAVWFQGSFLCRLLFCARGHSCPVPGAFVFRARSDSRFVLGIIPA